MSFNWKIVTDKLYWIIKGSCEKLVMYDAKGNKTIDPDDATRFFATFTSYNPELDDFTILVALHDQGQNSYINIKTPNLKDDDDFKTVYQLRNHIRKAVSQREGIKVVWQVFDHAIDPREEAVHNIKESKDVSKWFGTTKSSFQRIGEAKLIIRHSDVVNEEKSGARTRHIRALFVENKLGERFSYPHLHMSGARAFARHISNGGSNHDAIAEGIMNLSSDYISLRRAAHVMRQNQIVTEWIVSVRENMNDINRRLKSLHGPKGYARAESILATQAIILDETATNSMWQKLAEECSCGQDEPFYGDLGVAAKYLSGIDNQPQPISFSWNRKPNISGAPDKQEVLERLHWQISELADACSDPHAAARLSEIAEMIADNVKPTDEDISLVREAIASSLTYTEAETVLPEEVELNEFFSEFSPEVIFAAESETTSQFIIGDKVRHKTQKLGAGRIVADLEGNEYPVRFGDDPEIYYTPAEDLELVENDDYNNIGDTDDGFFVIIGNEDNGVFVGMVTKEGGKWKESTIAGNTPQNWGVSGYESYLSPDDVMTWIKREYGNYNHVEGPFTDEHEAMQHARELGLDSGEGEYDDDIDENDSHGITQKARERREEITYNDGQREKRWNFGEPVEDETPADSDLEENSYTPDTKYIWDPYARGEVVAQAGDYYLLHAEDQYDRHTTKNEWYVWKKDGDKFTEIEHLDISPYAKPREAVDMFVKKYSNNETSTNNNMQADDVNEVMLERIKRLAGL
jgi:hypothetical protein